MNDKKIRKSGSERRAEILQAALDIIGEQGLGQLTFAALASRVGISDAGIIKYFSSKSDIIYEVTASFTESLLKEIKLMSIKDCSATEKIDELFRMHTKTLMNNCGIPRLVFIETIHLQDERVCHVITNTQLQLRLMLAGIINQGIEEGVIRGSIDVESATFTYLALIQFSVSQHLIKQEDADQEPSFDRIKAYFIRSLLN